MDARTTDRAVRVMAAAISRRRALKGAVGAAALGLAGRRHPAAGGEAEVARLLDLPRAVAWPSDLPDGERFALGGSVSYLGVRGAIEAQALEQRMLDALAPVEAALIGGHASIARLLDGATDAWWTTTNFQFASTEDAQQALDGTATVYFAGTQEVTPTDARGRFFTWTVAADDGFAQARAVVFRTTRVVTAVIGWTRSATEPPAPAPAEVVEALEAVRRSLVRRLEPILDEAPAGLGATIPTTADLAGAADGRLGPGVRWWFQSYTQMDGRPIRQFFQTEEEFARFQTRFGEAREAFTRFEQPITAGGNPLVVQVDAFRYDGEDGAEAHLEGIGAWTVEDDAADDSFAAHELEPPPDWTGDRPSRWYEVRLPDGSVERLGRSALVQNGPDVVALLVAGRPRPPTENDDPAYGATLARLVAAGLTLYDAWNGARERGAVSEDLIAAFEDPCGEYDDALA